MKKKILLIVLCILTLVYLQFGRKAVLNTSSTSKTPEGYQLDVTITVNTLYVGTKEQMTQRLIEKILNNDFQNMQLSYEEYGHPNELHLTVYANSFGRLLALPSFRVKCVQEVPYQYNLKDHPEMFVMTFE